MKELLPITSVSVVSEQVSLFTGTASSVSATSVPVSSGLFLVTVAVAGASAAASMSQVIVHRVKSSVKYCLVYSGTLLNHIEDCKI